MLIILLYYNYTVVIPSSIIISLLNPNSFEWKMYIKFASLNNKKSCAMTNNP